MGAISKQRVIVIWTISALLLVALWYGMRWLGYEVSVPGFLLIVASVIVGGWFADRKSSST